MRTGWYYWKRNGEERSVACKMENGHFNKSSNHFFCLNSARLISVRSQKRLMKIFWSQPKRSWSDPYHAHWYWPQNYKNTASFSAHHIWNEINHELTSPEWHAWRRRVMFLSVLVVLANALSYGMLSQSKLWIHRVIKHNMTGSINDWTEVLGLFFQNDLFAVTQAIAWRRM